MPWGFNPTRHFTFKSSAKPGLTELQIHIIKGVNCPLCGSFHLSITEDWFSTRPWHSFLLQNFSNKIIKEFNPLECAGGYSGWTWVNRFTARAEQQGLSLWHTFFSRVVCMLCVLSSGLASSICSYLIWIEYELYTALCLEMLFLLWEATGITWFRPILLQWTKELNCTQKNAYLRVFSHRFVYILCHFPTHFFLRI